MALVRCEELVEDGLCGDWHHPELKAADGTPRCLRHRPAERKVVTQPIDEKSLVPKRPGDDFEVEST